MLNNVSIEQALKLSQKLHSRYLYINSTVYVDQKTGAKVRGDRLHRIKALGSRLEQLSMTPREKEFLYNLLGIHMAIHTKNNGHIQNA